MMLQTLTPNPCSKSSQYSKMETDRQVKLPYLHFFLNLGWRRCSGRFAWPWCCASWVRTGVHAEHNLGRESSGKGCWCSWDVDPLCGCCRLLSAAHLESSDLSSHTQMGTDISYTYRGKKQNICKFMKKLKIIN